MDGAMGTMLQQYGLPPGECPERLNLHAPDIVARVHREYAEAGAQLVETNTFGATAIRLAHFGLEKQVAEINTLAVEAARGAVGDGVMVAGAIGPLGELLEPYGAISVEAARAAYGAQVEALAAAGVDACVVETMADLTEACLAVEAVVAVGLPAIAQMSYDESGRTFMGVRPARAADALAAAGARAIGTNCSVGPAEMVAVVEELHASTGLPVSALPNAGLPQVVEGALAWPLTPSAFAAWGVRLAEAGATLIGGCCGTTPQHIALLAEALRCWQARRGKIE